MAQHPTRVYKAINASALLGPGTVFRFRAAAPAGSVGTVTVAGRRVRVALQDYLVNDERHGRVHAAEFLDVYL
ncbi:hypothetical protein [Streptomyces sp. NPDC056190]|uniref:hypothetical protein n=1 Tax=unclassified Streptomyces TaxID=2593676 RepID=UPI0035DBBC94